ncbi:hypothetical protein SAMN04487947_0080 [Halogeometricum rufum]|jgi:hypothetical protein|uniref:Halobacterial output domain-containing protein n=1 Tax=Halogeometricum rufum TaxID=553469 RepID=A0A1I6FVC5_9EURY|nr:HalOD1 output domain-containing protein [Halogeometricum rufum]SFR33915.1 hypothetical protein SAMN04487947_0080 [Halogeometricum rufum]
MNERKNVTVRPEEDLCFTIVETVSDLTNTPPLELDPLGNVVETDALETLFGPARETAEHDAYLTFRYEGCSVAVDSDGSVSVTRAPTPADVDQPISLGTDANSAAGDRYDANYR